MEKRTYILTDMELMIVKDEMTPEEWQEANEAIRSATKENLQWLPANCNQRFTLATYLNGEWSVSKPLVLSEVLFQERCVLDRNSEAVTEIKFVEGTQKGERS